MTQVPCAIITFMVPVPRTEEGELQTPNVAFQFANDTAKWLEEVFHQGLDGEPGLLRDAFGFDTGIDMVELPPLRAVE